MPGADGPVLLTDLLVPSSVFEVASLLKGFRDKPLRDSWDSFISWYAAFCRSVASYQSSLKQLFRLFTPGVEYVCDCTNDNVLQVVAEVICQYFISKKSDSCSFCRIHFALRSYGGLQRWCCHSRRLQHHANEMIRIYIDPFKYSDIKQG